MGIAALIALGILRHLDLARHEPDSAEVLHLQIEAMKLAIVGAAACVCDPGSMRTGGDELLNPERLRALAEGIDPERAAPVAGALATDRGTVYIAAADAEGTMVSFIQSNFHGFGSGIVIPGTGISMQNRGAGFSTDPAHPNWRRRRQAPLPHDHPGVPVPRRPAPRPDRRDGGHMQPRGHVQLVCRMEDFGQSLQEAIDAPRWHVDEDFGVNLEPGFGAGVARDLEARGHRIVTDHSWTLFGGAWAVLRRGDSYEGASDPRKDGCAAGY
ncbi:MAG: gamma-glutamyltransferase family protein [Gammaproteobacteria bacterium]|nr:gamma-glutamyltransferase family protein [Gammaproteobacteria bacterium]